ncbi:hypothetical protein GQ457_11G002600 [Hibiscus cannabinus]
MDKVTVLTSEKGVVLFSKSSCCLCYAVKVLFQELGVTPTIYEMDQDPEGGETEKALMRLGCNAPVPAIFIDGRLIGSMNEWPDKGFCFIRLSLTHALTPSVNGFLVRNTGWLVTRNLTSYQSDHMKCSLFWRGSQAVICMHSYQTNFLEDFLRLLRREIWD